MYRLAISLIAATAVFLAFTTLVSAQEGPTFNLGFKALADQIPDVVGEPSENEHSAANGDSLQQTTTGLMVWRKADNWTAFTNGSRTWINGPNGVESRSNNELLLWESPQPAIQPTATSQSQAPATPQPAAAPQPIVPPTTTPLPIPTPPPAPTGYRYIDPRAIASDPSAYIGQKVVLDGVVLKHVYLNDLNASRIEFLPNGFYNTNPFQVQSFVVRFFPKQLGIEKFDSIRVYGTITGKESEKTYDTLGTPWVVFSVGITGDHLER